MVKQNLYNVHIYREIRFCFDDISAPSHERAARIASTMRASVASEVDDCGGEPIRAFVTVEGDADVSSSKSIDFEPAWKLRIHKDLVAALQAASNFMADGLDTSDEVETRIFGMITDALDKATSKRKT